METDINELRRVVPLVGRDEMNLIEFPFGPISRSGEKTMEVEHKSWDKVLKRNVVRMMIITGADKFGLPRPIDEQVLIGMKALTHKANFASPRVDFSRYELCKTIGWQPDGRAYRRLEESFDRLAGTTFKFKDAWWDKGECQWKSKTFHLIQEVDLCSRDQLDRARTLGEQPPQLCSFVWTEVMWKSFNDGYIKKLDMQLFRRIARGRRRELSLRLFRVLDKRWWHGPVAKFKVQNLAVGILGLSSRYSPSQITRILDRAGRWLNECGCLGDMWYRTESGVITVYFRKQQSQRLRSRVTNSPEPPIAAASDALRMWLLKQKAEVLSHYETEALGRGFDSKMVRSMVEEERAKGTPVLSAGRIRLEFIRKYMSEQLQLINDGVGPIATSAAST